MMMELSSLYVLVRKDLAWPARAVQAGHAVAAYMLKSRGDFVVWENSTLIYLGVGNTKKLKAALLYLESMGEDVVVWREPDLDNSLTAIAVLPRKTGPLRWLQSQECLK